MDSRRSERQPQRLHELYVNGVQASSKSIADWQGINISNTLPLTFGRHSTYPLYWPGCIDEVAIYQRLLDSDDIEGLSTPPKEMEPQP